MAGATLAAGLWLAAEPGLGQSVPQLQPPLENALAAEIEVETATEPLRRKRPVTVDPYAAVGIGMGVFTFYPSLTVAGVVTSNVEQAASGEQSAAGLRLQPALRFESDWLRHSWTGEAIYDRISYFDHEDLTSQEGSLFSKFRLDIRRTTRAEFEAAYDLDQTGLADSEIPETAIGFRAEHMIKMAAALIHDFGPVEGRVKAGTGWRLYDDVELAGGGIEDNADRDYSTPLLSLRATYTDPPLFKPYLQAAYEPRHYLRNRDRDGLQRSSQGLALSAGVVIDRDPIWSGDLAVTYLWRDYDDPALDSNSNIGLDGSLTWRPDELTKLVLAFETSLEDSVSATSSSNRNWTARLDFAHELRGNVEVLAGAGVEIEDTGTGDDVTYDANLGLVWKLGPSLAWTAGYDVEWLDAAASARGFTEHRISAGLTLSR